MHQEIQLTVTPREASEREFYLPLIAQKIGISSDRITSIRIKGRSIDARKRQVKINLRADVWVDENPEPKIPPEMFDYADVSNKEPVIIVGAGPAGLFAALKLIECGIKPIIIERGKDIHARKRDIAAIHRNDFLNADSNYAFGEGGAGTFSDGKLYTRSKKRGNIKNILNILCVHGADPSVLIDAHPHIGSNKLPSIIESIRNTIRHFGGEVHFEQRLESLLIANNKMNGIVLTNDTQIKSKALILATGHSARDIYYMLDREGISLEAKSFAMGVRIEHPQSLVDSIQYSCNERGPYLPPASYSLVQQVDGRGVYSFCMCPGGVIVPASTAIDEMVVNGMSPSKRNSKFANSGIVVEIQFSDVGGDQRRNVLKGLEYQMAFERAAFKNGGKGQIAPAQRMVDFVENRLSSHLPESSFLPGLHSSPLHEWIPSLINSRLKDGLKQFGQKMRGYFMNDAILVGVESRTSSPVRVPRDRESFQHPQIEGLYPCGEGAGYAGGIVSSAIDGEKCAVKVADFL